MSKSIQKQFQKCINSYDDFAIVQHEMADLLVKNLRNIIKNSYLCNDYKIFTQKIEKEYKKAWKNFCR